MHPLCPIVFVMPIALAQAQVPNWAGQFGTAQDDIAHALSRDGSGSIFVGGTTSGDFGGVSLGGGDLCVAKHDPTGQRLWLTQHGTPADEVLTDLLADGLGGAFACGYTWGSLGAANAGANDAWLGRLGSNGQFVWVRQFGTNGGFNGADGSMVLAPDGAGGCFVGGYTYGSLFGSNSSPRDDAWLARYDGAGARLWAIQFGTTGYDELLAMKQAPGGGVYIAGITTGALGGPFGGGSVTTRDLWVAHYSNAGLRNWIRQYGYASDDDLRGLGVSSSGEIWIAGSTNGVLFGSHSGGRDAWIARLANNGSLLSATQVGTVSDDYFSNLAAGYQGAMFVAGITSGSLAANNAGSSDCLLGNFSHLGTQIQMYQFGTPSLDQTQDVDSDGVGGVVATGISTGSLWGSGSGGWDWWLARWALSDCYPDGDGDGFGSGTPISVLGSCGSGASSSGDDCDDTNAGIHPGAVEFCDGLDNDCDGLIDNHGPLVFSYCTPGTSTNGCRARLGSIGTPSASAGSGFILIATQVEGQRMGYLYYGVTGAQATSWGPASILCVAPPRQRMAANAPTGGTSGYCDGVVAQDWNAYIANHPSAIGQPFSAGQQVWAQAYYRDPPSPKTTNLSDALRFTLCP